MMERNEGMPSGDTLLRFGLTGYNPGWLLTGLGPEKLDDARSDEASGRSDLAEKLAIEFSKLPEARQSLIYGILTAIISNELHK